MTAAGRENQAILDRYVSYIALKQMRTDTAKHAGTEISKREIDVAAMSLIKRTAMFSNNSYPTWLSSS